MRRRTKDPKDRQGYNLGARYLVFLVITLGMFAYLLTGDYKTVAHTIVNALAIVSGIVCDGAKPSCAAKIASAVDAGLLGFYMYQNGQQFRGGDGIVTKGVENTIRNVSQLFSGNLRLIRDTSHSGSYKQRAERITEVYKDSKYPGHQLCAAAA